MRRFERLIWLSIILVPSLPAWATHPCTSPLILDLDGDGVLTTGISYGVDFDINGDGELNRIGWTFWEGQDAFLWLDLNRNSVVDGGSELFGNSTWLILEGTHAKHGFAALAQYDRGRLGGNEDGVISDLDFVWGDLRLWLDADQDGVSQLSETTMLEDSQVLALGLRFREILQYDGAGNLHAYRGWLKRLIEDPLDPEFSRLERREIVDDVFFRVLDEEDQDGPVAGGSPRGRPPSRP